MEELPATSSSRRPSGRCDQPSSPSGVLCAPVTDRRGQGDELADADCPTLLRARNSDDGDHPGARWKSQSPSETAAFRLAGDSACPWRGCREYDGPASRAGCFPPIFQRFHLPASSTTPFGEFATRRFRVTHAFHPLLGRDSELVARHNNWGEDRVYFSLPASWTSVEEDDPFRVIAAGRPFFRVTDLRELVRLIGGQTA